MKDHYLQSHALPAPVPTTLLQTSSPQSPSPSLIPIPLQSSPISVSTTPPSSPQSPTPSPISVSATSLLSPRPLTPLPISVPTTPLQPICNQVQSAASELLSTTLPVMALTFISTLMNTKLPSQAWNVQKSEENLQLFIYKTPESIIKQPSFNHFTFCDHSTRFFLQSSCAWV